MRSVTAVRQAQCPDSIAGLSQALGKPRLLACEPQRGAATVGVIGTIQCLGAVNSQLLRNINELPPP